MHSELATTDLAKAKEFYGKLFGWKLEDTPMADGSTYTMIDVGENEYGVGGGMMKVPAPDMPSAWLTYVSVDDVAAATEKVRALGGRVYRDVTEIPGMGAFSVVADPTGAALGLWESRR
ncbi:MAG TPA: VOC family protein [Candidatus Acidoferrales bacterium]|nr:VOC family protein [Candidatus Acidoferrales bacterium]